MIRKIVIATATYLGRRVIARAASQVVKRVLFPRKKAEEKSQDKTSEGRGA